MKRCPFCAEEIQDAAIVCKHCGREVAPEVHIPPNWVGKSPGSAVGCPYCGATVKIGQESCAKCQAALPTVANVAAAPPPAKRGVGFFTILIAGVAILGGLAFVMSLIRGATPEGRAEAEAESRTKAERVEFVQKALKAGLVQRYECTGNEAYVSPAGWAMLNSDGKRGLTRSLAAACDAQDSGDRITVIDAQSGRRLAKFFAGSYSVD